MKNTNKIVVGIVFLLMMGVPEIAKASGYSVNGYQVNSSSTLNYVLEAWANTYADKRVARVGSYVYGNEIELGKDIGVSWSSVKSIRNIYQRVKVYNTAQDNGGVKKIDYKTL